MSTAVSAIYKVSYRVEPNKRGTKSKEQSQQGKVGKKAYIKKMVSKIAHSSA